MSFDTLVNTVATELKTSDEDAWGILYDVYDIAGELQFTDIRLIAKGFSIGLANSVLKVLFETGYANKYVNYTCEKTGYADTTSTELLITCEGCGQPITYEDDSHDLVNIFELTDEFILGVENKKELLLMDILMNGYMHNFQLLKKKKIDIIPFLGAGVAMPLGVPGWTQMLKGIKPFLKDSSSYNRFEKFFLDGDFLNALTYLKRNSVTLSTDEQIKKYIVELFEEKLNLSVEDEEHNNKDLANLNSSFYITTNYETSLSHFISNGTVPLLIGDIEDIPKLMKEHKQRVLHLHGMVDKPKSMIVTIEDYEELYKDESFVHKLSAIMSNKVLLFIGWSFTDKFFKDMYTRIRGIIKGEHFIVVPNVDDYDAQEWAKDGLRTIGLRVKKDENGKTDYDDLVKVMKQFLNELNR